MLEQSIGNGHTRWTISAGGFSNNVSANEYVNSGLKVRANDQIYMVGFLDSGTVEDSVKITNYRVSAGVGVRIVVPMLGPMPIALDFGFPITRTGSDREQIFNFWVGYFH